MDRWKKVRNSENILKFLTKNYSKMKNCKLIILLRRIKNMFALVLNQILLIKLDHQMQLRIRSENKMLLDKN